MNIEQKVVDFGERLGTIRRELGRAMVGQESTVELVLVTLLARGHALLEGLPGLGKTYLVKSLAHTLGLAFSRIQFTPDLMPADVTGTNIITEDSQGRRIYEFRRGPLFANLVLADEINRATPKTQAAMLEAMQEAQVTAWGTTHQIDPPLCVLATQNPIEMEGTYPLPEAQLDRFMLKILVEPLSKDHLSEVVRRTTVAAQTPLEPVMNKGELLEWQGFAREVTVAPHVLDFASRLVVATSPKNEAAPPRVKEYVRFGASPRAAQALVLAGKVLALIDGRMNLAFSDLRRLAAPVLRHRLVLGYQAQMDGVTPDDLVADLLKAVREDDDA